MGNNRKPQRYGAKEFSNDFKTNYNNILPPHLSELTQFVGFNSKKIPINPKDGTFASSTNPQTWGTFAEALQAVEKYPQVLGIGIVLGNTPYGNLCGLDIDECIDSDGNIAPEAQELIDLLDSYTEISISGTGIHVLFFAEKITDKCKNTSLEWCKALELYDKDRYFTLSGRRIN